MSFGGHVSDMVNRMKQNRAQRPSNRPKFKADYRESIYSGQNSIKPSTNVFQTKNTAAIIERIRVKAKFERKKTLAIYGLAFFLGLIILILILLKIS